MNQLHKRLMDRFPWYARWHQGTNATVYNFLLLAAICAAAVYAFQAVIGFNFENEFAAVIQTVETGKPATPQISIREYNTLLSSASKQYSKAVGGEKEALLTLIIKLATDRKAAMLAQMPTNAAKVLSSKISPSLAKQLPADVQALLESDVDVEGTITVLHRDDFETHQDLPLEYYVKSSKSGKQFRVRFADNAEPGTITTGTKVRLHGVLLESELAVAGADASGGTTVTAQALSGSGHNTIVMLLTFADNPSQPFTPLDATRAFFTSGTSTRAYYLENSYGAVGFTGDVVGWYTLGIPSSSCNPDSLATAADAAAAKAGVNFANYAHKVYIASNGCGTGIGGGLGTVGGNPSQAWIGYLGVPTNDPTGSSNRTSKVVNHELGHNLGIHHASSIDCGTVQMAPYTNCTNQEYGDPSDVMGSTNYSAQFDAPHKIALGWIDGASVQTVTGSGSYSISPVENASGVRVLKIAKPNTGDAYYVSYRHPTNFWDYYYGTNYSGFVAYNGTSTNAKGVSIHVWDGIVGSQTHLVDTTPGDNNHLNAALLDGTAFGDPVSGLNITQLSHSDTGAAVNIQLGSYTDGITPTAALYDATAQALLAGGYFSGQSTFVIKGSDDVGVTKINLYRDGSLIGSAATNPATIVWDTTKDADGSHTLLARAYDAAGHIGISASVVVNADNVPPTAMISAPLTGAAVSGKVSFTVTPNDNIQLASFTYVIDGVPVSNGTPWNNPGSSYTYVWDTSSVPNGTHILQVVATDSAGNSGASDTVTVSTSGSTQDLAAPVVSITAPVNNSTLTGVSTVTVSALDSFGVTKVELYKNNVLFGTDQNPPYTFTWDTSKDPNTSYSIQAKAYDAAGNIGVSNWNTYFTQNTITDSQVPITSIASPTSGSTVSGTVTVSASATDNTAVSRVELWKDGALLSTDTASPYSFAWGTTADANGSHQLQTKAYDAAGNVGTSALVSVTVANLTNNDTSLPTVSITSPANGTKIKGGGGVSIKVTASDPSGISSIVIETDGVIRQNCLNVTSCTYSWSGKSITTGTHTITATAVDKSTNQNTNTTSITITK